MNIDIFDHYMLEENNHIPLLLEFLSNESQKIEGELLSNLFNFKVDFLLDVVIIEDDAGLFCESESDRHIKTTVSKLVERIANANS